MATASSPAAAAQHEQPDLGILVDALCASGRAAEAHHRVSLLFLSSSAAAPSRHAADGLLRRLLRAGTPILTLRLVQAAPPAALVPSLPNYNRLLALLCRGGGGFSSSAAAPLLVLVLLAHRLFLRMRATPDAASYASLLDGYARVPDPGAVRKLLDEMPRRGVSPSSLARTYLVKALLRSRDVDGAMDLVDNHLWPSMERDNGDENQELKNAAFANLVQCLCSEGFFHIVFRIAEEMPQQRCGVADGFAYAQMIDSLCRSGQHHGASRIVYIMGKRGMYPSTVSYNCIVHGLCTSQKPGGRLRAYQLVMEGVRFGYRPREVTYKVLVDQLCRENELTKAKDVMELMLHSQYDHEKVADPDDDTRTRIYNMFLGALRVVDNPTEQLDVLVSMLQEGCKPDVITMNTVIHGFCKVGRAHEARKIVNDMLNGKFCAPDVVTFTTLISGYLGVGEFAEALHVLESLMPKRQCLPNAITYNCVLKGLLSCGLVDRSMQIFEEMKCSNVVPDSVTHAVMIKGLCDAGQLEKAKSFWDNVVWPSGMHDDYVYSAIFRGLCKLGKLEQACDFLYELVDCGISPSVVCYNILVDAACKQGSKKLAYQIVKEMKRNGLSPDAVTWRIIDRLHLCSNEEQDGEIQVSTIDVDPSFTDNTVDALVSNGDERHKPSSPSETSKIGKVVHENSSQGEEEVDYSPCASEDPPNIIEPGEEEACPMNNSTTGTTMDNSGMSREEGLMKPDKQPLKREPLSRVARKVFGLL
uniref:Pentacotripeptide-repeat region of PRORP domain-containing protein n=1 Tax=Leersia perrieri TaxID=77586 RepID=A0A0D9X2V0_9ORYZ